MTEEPFGGTPYSEQNAYGQGAQAVCIHKFVTGADGAVYCQKCGTVLHDTMFQNSNYLSTRPVPEPKRPNYWPVLILAMVVVLAVSAFLGWKFITRRPAAVASVDKAPVIDISREPEQLGGGSRVLYRRGDGLSISSLSTYRIWGKALCVRAYAGFDKGSSGFPIDLGIAWGNVAKSDYHKFVNFSFSNDESANQWLMFKFKTQDVPWETDYFESHVSNNHICPANENIYNALMSLKDGDVVCLEGYLAESWRADGQTILTSSLSRNDTLGGACEAFYVTKLQVADQVYK